MIATTATELPEIGQLMCYPFDTGRSAKCELAGSVRYQVNLQLEHLPPEQFQHVHEELALEGARKGLVFQCKIANRFSISPLSVVIATALPTGLSTAAFHTFPDELAIIKTQSLIEWS
jgi:hypothetical protein